MMLHAGGYFSTICPFFKHTHTKKTLAIHDNTSKTQEMNRFSVVKKHISLGAPGINVILMSFKPVQP